MQVPLDHHNKQTNNINLFVREVTALNKVGHKLPTLLFLQGQLSFASVMLCTLPG